MTPAEQRRLAYEAGWEDGVDAELAGGLAIEPAFQRFEQMHHFAPTTVTRVTAYKGRWVITLSCQHKVRVAKDALTVKEGDPFLCPEREIGVVYD